MSKVNYRETRANENLELGTQSTETGNPPLAPPRRGCRTSSLGLFGFFMEGFSISMSRVRRLASQRGDPPSSELPPSPGHGGPTCAKGFGLASKPTQVVGITCFYRED